MNLTNMHFVRWTCNRFERTCVMFSEFAMSHERNNFIETISSDFSISHCLREHQSIIWSKIVRRRRQFYFFVFRNYLIIIARRRFCIHKIIKFDENRNLNKSYDSYNRFRVKQMMNTNDVDDIIRLFDENSSFMRNYMNVACDRFRTKQTVEYIYFLSRWFDCKINFWRNV